jgi:hypothetical protein
MTLSARQEVTMADVGTVRTTIAIENPLARGQPSFPCGATR